MELLRCRRIWRPNCVDLILISSLSNQSFRWIQSGLSTVIPLQRKKHNLEMFRALTHPHTQHTDRLRNESFEYQKDRQKAEFVSTYFKWAHRTGKLSPSEYLCSFCHLVFKLWLSGGIFLHIWLVGLCSFFGFNSSLKNINRQINDYNQFIYLHNGPMFSELRLTSEGKKVLGFKFR